MLITATGQLKLGDVGMACRAADCYGSCGTPEYCAPEVTAHETDPYAAPYGPPADLFSVGATLLALSLRCNLLPCATYMLGHGMPLGLLDEELEALLAALLANNPAKRATAAEALRMPFLSADKLASEGVQGLPDMLAVYWG